MRHAVITMLELAGTVAVFGALMWWMTRRAEAAALRTLEAVREKSHAAVEAARAEIGRIHAAATPSSECQVRRLLKAASVVSAAVEADSPVELCAAAARLAGVERRIREERGAEGYYILALKYTRDSDFAFWFQPDDNGYTRNLDDAGIYPADRVESMASYYRDGVNTLPVPVAEARALVWNVVRTEAIAKHVGL